MVMSIVTGKPIANQASMNADCPRTASASRRGKSTLWYLSARPRTNAIAMGDAIAFPEKRRSARYPSPCAAFHASHQAFQNSSPAA